MPEAPARNVSTGVFDRCETLSPEKSAKSAQHHASGLSSHRVCMLFLQFGSSSVLRPGMASAFSACQVLRGPVFEVLWQSGKTEVRFRWDVLMRGSRYAARSVKFADRGGLSFGDLRHAPPVQSHVTVVRLYLQTPLNDHVAGVHALVDMKSSPADHLRLLIQQSPE